MGSRSPPWHRAPVPPQPRSPTPPFLCFLRPVQGALGGAVTVCLIGACAALLSVKEIEIYLCMFLRNCSNTEELCCLSLGKWEALEGGEEEQHTVHPKSHFHSLSLGSGGVL